MSPASCSKPESGVDVCSRLPAMREVGFQPCLVVGQRGCVHACKLVRLLVGQKGSVHDSLLHTPLCTCKWHPLFCGCCWCFGNGCDTPSTCRIIIVNAIDAAPHWRGAIYKCTAQLLLGLRAQLLLWVLYVRLQAGMASPCI